VSNVKITLPDPGPSAHVVSVLIREAYMVAHHITTGEANQNDAHGLALWAVLAAEAVAPHVLDAYHTSDVGPLTAYREFVARYEAARSAAYAREQTAIADGTVF